MRLGLISGEDKAFYFIAGGIQHEKVLALTLAALAALALFAGCSKSKTDPGTIVVGASVTPHAEILEQVRELLKEKVLNLKSLSSRTM